MLDIGETVCVATTALSVLRRSSTAERRGTNAGAGLLTLQLTSSEPKRGAVLRIADLKTPASL